MSNKVIIEQNDWLSPFYFVGQDPSLDILLDFRSLQLTRSVIYTQPAAVGHPSSTSHLRCSRATFSARGFQNDCGDTTSSRFYRTKKAVCDACFSVRAATRDLCIGIRHILVLYPILMKENHVAIYSFIAQKVAGIDGKTFLDEVAHSILFSSSSLSWFS
jgi:hypothetical protein